MPESRRSYLPAAGHDWFLPLYDPFVKLMGGDRARRALLDQSAIRPGHVARLIHSAHRLQDNSEARVLDLMRHAGFMEVRSTGRRAMLFGRIGYYAAA